MPETTDIACCVIHCEGFREAGFLTVILAFIFGVTLFFLNPFFALVFAILMLFISVISQEIQGRRRLRTAGENRRPIDIEAQVRPEGLPEPTPVDMSLLVLRKVEEGEPIVTCEICLDDLLVGQEVAGSQNKDCIHEFHRDCIKQALNRQTTCPCCRREYLHPADEVVSVVVPGPTEEIPPSPETLSPERIRVDAMNTIDV